MIYSTFLAMAVSLILAKVSCEASFSGVLCSMFVSCA